MVVVGIDANIRQAFIQAEAFVAQLFEFGLQVVGFLDERAAAVETSDGPSEALFEIEPASAARSPASLRHAESRGKKLQHSPEEAASPRALALDLAPAGLLQAVVLAEIIGRPKAQRRRSPYFRS